MTELVVFVAFAKASRLADKRMPPLLPTQSAKVAPEEEKRGDSHGCCSLLVSGSETEAVRRTKFIACGVFYCLGRNRYLIRCIFI